LLRFDKGDCLEHVPEQLQADVRRVFDLSPFFAMFMRTVSLEE